MDFAADAVMDVIAPTPGRAPARGAPESGPTFDDHLAAEADPKPAPAGPDAQTSTEPTAPGTPDAIATAITPPAPIELPGAPVLLQVIASAPAQNPAAPATAEPNLPSAPAASAPVQAVAPAAPRAAPNPAPDMPIAPAADSDATPAPGAEARAKPVPAQTSAATPNGSPHAQAAEGIASVALVHGQQPVPQPVQQAVQTAPAAPIIAPAPTAPIAPPAARAAPVEAKPQTETGKSAPAPGANANVHSKSAQGKSNTAPAAAPGAPAGDFGAFALRDAPDAPSPTNSAAITTQSASQASQASSAEQNVARAAPAAAQVSREIIRRFDGANTRFELRLDPPELGRVDIKLEVARDHRVTAVISADNPQALTDLVRHVRDLEQSLQAAGLELGENGLSFDLRQGDENMGEAASDAAREAGLGDADLEDAPHSAAPQTARLERWRGMRIDVMA